MGRRSQRKPPQPQCVFQRRENSNETVSMKWTAELRKKIGIVLVGLIIIHFQGKTLHIISLIVRFNLIAYFCCFVIL